MHAFINESANGITPSSAKINAGIKRRLRLVLVRLRHKFPLINGTTALLMTMPTINQIADSLYGENDVKFSNINHNNVVNQCIVFVNTECKKIL